MKIGNGYVTNSSSTSFVITSQNGLTKESFYKTVGVSEESLLVEMYDNLYKAIHANLEQIPSGVSIKDYLEKHRVELSDEDVVEIQQRYSRGDKVYWGELSDSGDDGGLAEAFFSHESFVVIGDDIYFNARNSTY